MSSPTDTPPSPYTVHHGDCFDVLKTLPDNSVDAVVTDPPYGLGRVKDIAGLLADWLQGGDGSTYVGSVGFMSKSWDAGVPSPVIWKEVLRVLKPGGQAIVFASTRTSDLMGISLRIAGFEIRDEFASYQPGVSRLEWLYGNGFPKSTDIAKEIDKREGYWRGRGRGHGHGSENTSMNGHNYLRSPKGKAVTSTAKQWEGYGTNVKPAHEPILLARKPIEGSLTSNVVQHGTGAINIEGCRIPTEADTGWTVTTRNYANGGRPPEHGRWPSNVLLVHHPECVEVERSARGVVTYDCVQDCPTIALKKQKESAAAYYQQFAYNDEDVPFLYHVKASAKERDEGLDTTHKQRVGGGLRGRNEGSLGDPPTLRRNHHPTVKPLGLMRWLVRLVGHPGAVILDPFAGSGTTVVAGIQEGFSVIGIEREEDYVSIARARAEYAVSVKATPPPTMNPTLFGDNEESSE